MYIGYGGGLLHVVLAIICILQVAQTGMDPTKKLLWILIILLIPILGSVIWLVLGRGA